MKNEKEKCRREEKIGNKRKKERQKELKKEGKYRVKKNLIKKREKN